MNQMVMSIEVYTQCLDMFRKRRLWKAVFFILSENQCKLKKEQSIAELAVFCKKLDRVMVKTKTGNVRPDPNDVLKHLFIPIRSVKTAKTMLGIQTYKEMRCWISEKKLSKFVETWELLRQVLANNIAAGKGQTEEYYADVIKMFLVNQIKERKG